MIIFETEKLAFMFSINFQIFETIITLSFFIIFGVRFPCFLDIYFLQISYLRPEIKAFMISHVGKFSFLKTSRQKYFEKSLFAKKQPKRLWSRKLPASSSRLRTWDRRRTVKLVTAEEALRAERSVQTSRIRGERVLRNIIDFYS